jgi:hypothetical protein
MIRKLLAGILGGLAFFAWSSIAHMALPLGKTGVNEVPNEQPVIAAMKSSISQGGLYIFPGTGLPANATGAQERAAMEQQWQKVATSPSGLLMYHPTRAISLPRMLLTEAATNIVQLLLAVFLLGQTSLASFGARWRFITVAGILASISTNISYWNWYGFPSNYTLAYSFTIAMGFVCAGLVAAAIVKPGAGMPSAMAARA